MPGPDGDTTASPFPDADSARTVHEPGAAKKRKSPVADATTSAVNSLEESSNRTNAPPGMGVRFDVVTTRVRELSGPAAPHLSPAELARENARRKAKAVAAIRPGRWVLGADTVVALERRGLGDVPLLALRLRCAG